MFLSWRFMYPLPQASPEMVPSLSWTFILPFYNQTHLSLVNTFAHSHPWPVSNCWQPIILFSRVIICHFSIIYMESMWYVTFRGWLFSFSIIPWRPIHIVVCISHSFLFIAEEYSMVQVYQALFITLPIEDLWVSCAIRHKAAVNTHSKFSFCFILFISFIHTGFHFSEMNAQEHNHWVFW